MASYFMNILINTLFNTPNKFVNYDMKYSLFIIFIPFLYVFYNIFLHKKKEKKLFNNKKFVYFYI